jgi:oligoribonuclease
VDVYTQEKLNWPYHWLDLASMYWVAFFQKKVSLGEPIPQKMSLSKNDIASQYQLPVEDLPHKALNGVNHLLLCYQAVLGIKYNF